MKRESKNGQIKEIVIDIHEIKTLIKVYNSITEAILLKTADVRGDKKEKVFSTSNIVGEFAEILVCERLGYTQCIASERDYDCLDKQDKKVQIKCRLMKRGRKNGQNRMGDIKQSALDNIDYVIVILFDDNFEIKYAFKLGSASYKKYSGKSKEKGYRLDLNSAIIEKIEQDIKMGRADVYDIKDALNAGTPLCPEVD